MDLYMFSNYKIVHKPPQDGAPVVCCTLLEINPIRKL